MKGPLLAIRADASREKGTGHIMRSLALAQEWRKRGGRCIFLCSSLPDALQQKIEDESCELHRLSHSGGTAKEAAETSETLQRLHPRWLLVDGYSFDVAYQRRLHPPQYCRIACISDFGPEDFHSPDLVIHPNIAITGDYDTGGMNPRVLAGPQYVLLRSEIRRIHPRTVTKSAARILISVGGSDPGEVAMSVTETLIEKGVTERAAIRVILGPAYPEEGPMGHMENPAVEIVRAPQSMKEHYDWADTAIGSPSTTALELAHHGVPSGLIVTAGNQLKVLEAMQDMDVTTYLGDARESVELQNLEELLDGEQRIPRAQRASELIDGKGPDRLCDELGLPSLQLRPAQAKDARDLWNWANDPGTRAASFNPGEISWESHLAWLDKQLTSSSVALLLVESSLGRLGSVRFETNPRVPDESIISVNLAPEFRGMGLAPLILESGIDVYCAQGPTRTIVAWIKPDNTASIRTFTRAGFTRDDTSTPQDRIKMTLTSPPA